MKLTKRLIPAFAMLLVSAVLMSTASFAWFSMNTEVTATGMTVSAKSDSIFLEIKGTEDGNAWKTTGTNKLNAELFPAAHEEGMTADEIEATNGDGTLKNWFFYYANDPTKSEVADDATKQACKTFGSYVAHATYDVRLNPQMVTTAKDVYVSNITIPDNKGITVIIVYDDNMMEFNAANDGEQKWTSDDDNIIDEMVDPEEGATERVYKIHVYIYIDGDDTNVFTNNADQLTGSVSFTLSASGADRVAQNP